MRPDHRILRALFLDIAPSWRIAEEGATLYDVPGPDEARRVFGALPVTYDAETRTVRIQRPALEAIATAVLGVIRSEMGMYVERATVVGSSLRVLTCVAKPEGLDWAEYRFRIEDAEIGRFYCRDAVLGDWQV